MAPGPVWSAWPLEAWDPILQNSVPGTYSFILLKGSRKLWGKKVLRVFYGWEENVCKWGESSKAFLESVPASCRSHWWAQLGWEVCADVLSESQPQSLPEAPLVLKHKVGITGWAASWRARAGVCGCLHLGTQRANRLRKLVLSRDTGNASWLWLPGEDRTWWSLVTRCPPPVAVPSIDGVSGLWEKCLPLPSPVMMESVGLGRNASWQLECDEDFGFWVSLLGQLFLNNNKLESLIFNFLLIYFKDISIHILDPDTGFSGSYVPSILFPLKTSGSNHNYNKKPCWHIRLANQILLT